MILFRGRDIILVILMLGLAAFTYKIKYEAQRQYNQISQIEREIEQARDTINLLQAEWALMHTPERIARLAKHYEQELALVPVQPIQISTLDAIPFPEPDAIDMVIAQNNDSILTFP